MPDLAMCEAIKDGVQCPYKDQCYRHTAKPCEFRQSYFCVAPFEIVEDCARICNYFWENK